MSHLSALELHAFVTRAESTPEFEAHVSDCAACAARLSAAARRAVAPVTLVEPVVTPPLQLALVAFMACLAVLLARTVTSPSAAPELFAPEGVHGVAPVVSVSFPASDAVQVDSGVR